MAGFDTTAASAILKEDYEPPVREYLNNATVLLKYIKRNTTDFVGKELYIPVRKGRNVGTGTRAEHANLPAAGSQQYDKLIEAVKQVYGRINLTGLAISSAKSNAGSFVRAIQSEMEGLMNDIKQNLSRQLWHDGSGILTRCKTTSNSTSIEVESTKFLKPLVGAVVDIVQIADGALDAGQVNQTIASVTDDDTFVVGTAATTSNVDCVILTETRRGPGTYVTGTWGTDNFDIWGLQGLINNANPGNGLTNYPGDVNRSTATWYNSNIIGNSAVVRPLTLDLMQQAFDQAEIEGDASPGLILTNHAIKRRYAALLVADKRYPPGGEITLDGGYKALEFNGVPLVADKDASLTLTPQYLRRLYFLTLSSLEFAVLEDFGWMDRDGSTLKAVSGKDEYEAVLYSYINLVCNKPQANSVLDDIDENP